MHLTLYPRDERFSNCHVMYIGFTGSGKTYKARRDSFAPPSSFHKYSKVSGIKFRVVFFDTSNSQLEENYTKMIQEYARIYNKSVGLAHSVESFIQYWDYGAKFIIVAPLAIEPESSYRAKVHEIVGLIRRYQASQKTQDRGDVYLYFDEISDLTKKVGESTVTWVFKRGRQLKIWGRAISQRPQMVNRIIYDETKYKIFFYLTEDQWKGLRNAATFGCKPSLEVMEDLDKTPYLYYIYDGTRWERGKVRE